MFVTHQHTSAERSVLGFYEIPNIFLVASQHAVAIENISII